MSMSKVCSKCKIEKDESEFYSNKRMPDGLDYYCKDCRKSKNEDNIETYYDNQEFIESLKTECCKCGEDRPWVIQFHHVNPQDKLFNLSLCGARSKSSLWKEASKCVCLCSNCHDEFHYFFGKQPINPVEALDIYLTDNRY
jgi:hypothetical protein